MSESSFFEQLAEFSTYLDANISIASDILNTLFYWNGNTHLFNYFFILLINFYFFDCRFYILFAFVFFGFLCLPSISFDERLSQASSMQLVLKGLNFKVIWIVISLFSENAANPFGSSIISAVGGYDSVEKIDPQLNFLRKKKQDILAFIGHFLMVAKRMQVLCNDIDNFLANPLGSVFELRVFVLCFVISKIKVSYLLMVLLNVALLWNWPPFMIFRGLSLYLYDSFLRFYFKKYFATVLIDRRVFWPVSVGNQNQNQWYIRIPTKAEILHRRILFFDLYDKTNNEIIRVLYLYENQRWWPGIGWTDMLKSTDRPRYSNESGSIGSSLLLPIEQQALHNFPNWQWIDSKWRALSSELPKFSIHRGFTDKNEPDIQNFTVPLQIVLFEEKEEESQLPFWEYSENSKSAFKANIGQVIEDLCRLRRRVLFRRMSVDLARFRLDFNTHH